MPDRRISTAVKNAEKRRRAKEDTIPPKDPMPTSGPGIDPNIKGIPAGNVSPPPPKRKPKYTASSNTVASTIAFRMPPFPKLEDVPEENKGLQKLPEEVRNNMGFKRYKEDESTGMLRMEELQPLNRMGSVALQRNEMPMAYRHKVVKKTGVAKAIPFTAK